uniref:Histone acetyltransferase n=1 Tax=Macrostomum lignano TaxID=282301 RepID=A0A1I8JJ82_9PLAT
MNAFQSMAASTNRCPVKGCDSRGHVNPSISQHCTLTACPAYRDRTGQPCEPDLSRVPLENRQSLQLFREAQNALASDAEQDMLAHWRMLPSEYQVEQVAIGNALLDVWYKSCLPADLACVPVLHYCEFCLACFTQRLSLTRHSRKCACRHPPGVEVYREGQVSLFEVDGRHFRAYCQSLCRLAKFFIRHKTLVEGVEAFVFYVLTEADQTGCRLIGYFSKEKRSLLNYNLSCLLVFPNHMRKGFGFLLIDLSYRISQLEGSVGSPERPLSDAGLAAYRKYWTRALLTRLLEHQGTDISVRDLSQETGIHANDIVSTLQSLELLKYWRGEHFILADKNRLRQKLSACLSTYMRLADPACLSWRPADYLTGGTA